MDFAIISFQETYKTVKKLFVIITSISFFLSTFSQDVTVLDKFSNFALAGVSVYALNSTDTLQTNADGEVNIGIFSNDDIIIFYMPYFKKGRYTKEELAKNHNTVYMDRGDALNKISSTSPLKSKEYSADLPFFIDIVDLDDQSTLNLDDEGGGERITFNNNEGGMSVFRGLEAGKMLLVLDGIRLNNAIHRNGKVERLLNFDQTMTKRVQQIYGTGFTIYSPDATGGVVQYFTTIPPLSQDYPFVYHVEANTKYESASKSSISNVNLSMSGLKFSSFTSVSYGNFGEITMGKNRKGIPIADSIYGLHLYSLERINDTDRVVINEEPYKQLKTDYEQLYILQKFRYKLGNYSNLILNFHYVNTSDVGIYSGLTEINGDHLRFAECRFEPQDKIIGSLNYLYEHKTIFFDFLSIQNTFSHFNEYRVTRKYKNPVALHQIENLNVYKFNADFVKLYNVNRMLYGIEYNFNKLTSNAFFLNIEADTTWQGLNRYPTNGSFAHDAALYWNYKWMNNPQFVVNLGARYNFNYSEAHFDNNSPQLPLTFTEKKYINHAPAASISFDTYPFRGLQVKLLLSSAQHSPIIDDFAKIMVKNFTANIPTDNLKSEKLLTGELGVTGTMFEKFRIYGSVFYTKMFDALISKDTVLNGNDSLYFGTDGYDIATKVNIPQAYIYGVSGGFNFNYSFDQKQKVYIKFSTSLNYVKGINQLDNMSLPNIPPFYGNTTLNFNFYSASLRVVYIFNGQKPYNELSPVGEDYIEKAASTGFLPWQTLNAKILVSVKDNPKISFGVDNIFDKFYRPYRSAIVAPGRNFIFSLKFAIK